MSPSRLNALDVAFRRAWFGVGPVATLHSLVRHLRRVDPEAHRTPASPSHGPHPFDTQYGVDTAGFLGWRDLQTGGRNDPYISGYFGVIPSIARHAVARVADPETYTFVDIGCGKGRAAILATERPFRRVLGIEIAAPLAEAARRNAAIVAARHPTRPPVEIIHADATAIDLPDTPLVLFLYQPFERPVMRTFLERLAQSLEAKPRPVLLLYVYPALAKLLDTVPWLQRLADHAAEPAPDERPFTYGGRGGQETYAVWGTHQPAPQLLPPAHDPIPALDKK